MEIFLNSIILWLAFKRNIYFFQIIKFYLKVKKTKFIYSNTSEDFEDNEEQYRGKTIPPVSVNSHLYCHSSNVHLPSPISNLDSKTQK